MRTDGSPRAAGGALRLFVALELPEPVRIATGAWAATELATIGELRPVRVDGLHVTLCFLGSTAGTEVEAIGACCRAACAGARPLRLSIGGPVGGPVALPRRRPRAIAVPVGDEGGRQLSALHTELADALAAGGWYRPQTRPFLAHVTVARVRPRARLDARALGERAGPSPTTFTADAVTLFESRTQPGGAVYRPRARIELAA